jgi:hypothetical protein
MQANKLIIMAELNLLEKQKPLGPLQVPSGKQVTK